MEHSTMNDILDLIHERRSAREPYDPNRPFTKHQLDQILEAASWAPTAHNMQNFEIVVVDNAKRSSDEACRMMPNDGTLYDGRSWKTTPTRHNPEVCMRRFDRVE
jgi:nitroreductase